MSKKEAAVMLRNVRAHKNAPETAWMEPSADGWCVIVAAPGRSYTIAGSAHYHAWLNAHERGAVQ